MGAAAAAVLCSLLVVMLGGLSYLYYESHCCSVVCHCSHCNTAFYYLFVVCAFVSFYHSFNFKIFVFYIITPTSRFQSSSTTIVTALLNLKLIPTQARIRTDISNEVVVAKKVE